MTGGASSPHPSLSTGPLDAACVLDLEPSGLKLPELPPTWVGVKTGFEANGGGGPFEEEVVVVSPEYLDPDASETLRMMLSADKSDSDRAVTCT